MKLHGCQPSDILLPSLSSSLGLASEECQDVSTYHIGKLQPLFKSSLFSSRQFCYAPLEKGASLLRRPALENSEGRRCLGCQFYKNTPYNGAPYLDLHIVENNPALPPKQHCDLQGKRGIGNA